LWVWGLAFLVGISLSWAVKHYVHIDSDLLKNTLEILSGFSSFVVAFLAGSRKLLTFVRKIRESKQELIEKTKQAIKQQVDQARENVEKAAEAVKTVNQQLENMRADRHMVDFIRQRYESSDYRGNLGVIARVRADFRHLSALLRDVQQESGKDVLEMKKRQEEKEKERKAPLFPRIDRIILYIDDLDRCPEKNVVEVLQAVHLLLAFPLFVVVVGVDPRWLLHSLRQNSVVFQKDGGDGEAEDTEDDSHWQSTPLNYLEKIFQIPFTLRPIGKSGFGKLVDTFAAQSKKTIDRPGPLVPRPETQRSEQRVNEPSPGPVPGSQKEPGPVVAAPPSSPASDAVIAPAPEPISALAAEEPEQKISFEQTGTQPEREPIDRHPEHLRIDERERVFMKALYELIPSPRAGKRFINIYRLLRASVEDNERPKFMGNDAGGDYQCALMLLAILTGYPSEATEILEDLIKEEHNENWGKFIESAKNKVHRQNPAARDSDTSRPRKQAAQGPSQQKDGLSLSASYPVPDLQRWDELFAKLQRLKGDLDDRKCEGFVRWAPRVARYSFQSGRVLLRLRE
jgi:hypothetical protein